MDGALLNIKPQKPRHGGGLRQSDMHKRYRKRVPKKSDASWDRMKQLLKNDKDGSFMDLFQSTVDVYLARKKGAQLINRLGKNAGKTAAQTTNESQPSNTPLVHSARARRAGKSAHESQNPAQLEGANDLTSLAPVACGRTLRRRKSAKDLSTDEQMVVADEFIKEGKLEVYWDNDHQPDDTPPDVDDGKSYLNCESPTLSVSEDQADDDDRSGSHAHDTSDDQTTSVRARTDPQPPLEYTIVPGAKRGHLLYVEDEKALYKRKVLYPGYHRYVCRTPKCPCVLHVSQPDGVARRAGRTPNEPHNHAQLEGGSDVRVLVKTKKANRTTTGTAEDLLEIQTASDADELNDHDADKVAESTDGGLEYEMVPGVRYGTRLLYVMAEKNLYSISQSYPRYDRYHCIARKCRCAVRLSKADGIVRRANAKAEHNHEHMEGKYLECSFKHSLKKACLSSKGMLSPKQLLDDGRQSDPDVAARIDLNKLGNLLSRYKRLGQLMLPRDEASEMHTPNMIADGDESLAEQNQLIDESVISNLQESDPTNGEMASVRRVKQSFSILRQTANAKAKKTIMANNPILCRSCGANPQQMSRKECSHCGTISDEMTVVPYVMVPGIRFGAQLLYTLGERMIYKLWNKYELGDRYVCNYAAQRCRCAIMVSRRDGTARRSGRSAQHEHDDMESDYLRNMFMHELKKDCMRSNGLVSGMELFRRREEIDPAGAEFVNKKSLPKLFKQYIPAAGSADCEPAVDGTETEETGAVRPFGTGCVLRNEIVVATGDECIGCGRDPNKVRRKVCPGCGCIRYVNKK